MTAEKKYMPDAARLVPIPDPITEPFWKAARRGDLSMQRCGSCKRLVFYPRSICPNCGSFELDWEILSGSGTIYSFSVVHRPAHPGMAGEVPYVVALVEVEEGVRLMTNIVECDPADVEVGMEVEVVFETLSEEIAIPLFRPKS
jgi:uncharacterized OB-fold protein